MFTDTVGYTASTQSNEARTLELLRDQEELLRPLLTAHHGREIKSTGDGFLVEFDSALKATQCAVNIQRRIYERNAEGSLALIQIRIGIHLGDVVQRDGDIFGDAVNIAARIEPIAPPGGICVSGAVHDQIRNKIPEKLEKLPTTALKGLELPIDIYRVVLPWTVTETVTRSSAPAGLAVLPFNNISPDSKDEYFADGLTEELISVLSQIGGLRVIARTSVMPYRSTTKGVSQIGAELRVASILEGSVRKAGNRLRVTAQLIDVGSEGHVWAKTYDRQLDDIFAVQSELATQVAEALKVQLQPAEQTRLETRPVVRSESYLAYLRGRTFLHSHSRDSLGEARKQFELAISLDERNASAYSGLADVYRTSWMIGADSERPSLDAAARRFARRALELDPNLAEAHASLGYIIWDDFEYAAAEKEFKLALSLNPSLAEAHDRYAFILEDQGRGEEAVAERRLAEASDPLSIHILEGSVRLLSWLGRYEEALPHLEKLRELGPDSDEFDTATAWYYRAQSDLVGASRAIRRMEDRATDPRMKSVWHALIDAWAGQHEEAKSLLHDLESQTEDSHLWAFVAFVYNDLGMVDECIRMVEKAISVHLLPFQPFQLDPRFRAVRDDPRFQVILKHMNLA
jgi:adenylate cyclase